MAIIHAPVRVAGRTAIQAALLAGCIALLAYQLRAVDFGALFADVRVGWVVAAVAAFVVSRGAVAHNITASAPLGLRAADTMRAQLAIGGLRMVAPSAVSTPAIGVRFLQRKGLALSTAMTVLAVAQTAQLMMTVVVVGAIALIASTTLPAPSAVTVVVVSAVVVVLLVAAIVGRRFERVRRATAAAVYLGASSAGSLVPTPGGIGAVESALIAGLIATGMSAQVATAAALLSRLVTVWAPALPGVIALRGLRRQGAL